MRRDASNAVLAWSSLAAGLLLLTLCAMTALTGVSQQRFEWVAPPDEYGALLVAHGRWLRALIAVDDLFIAAYVVATLSLARRLARRGWTALTIAAAAGGVVAGVLDLHENHELLAMAREASLGEAIPLADIHARSVLSQLKWMIGHLAFVGVGAAWPARRTLLDRTLVASLLFVQLPLGALVWTLTDPAWLEVAVWARYGSFLAGFFVIAGIALPRAAPSGASTGAPA